MDEKQLKIVKSVVETALSQVEGVLYVGEDSVDASLVVAPKRKKGVSVAIVGDKVVIDVSVSVVNGYPIPDVACNCQNKIKAEVEKSVRVHVKTVNVNVDGIIFKR